MFWKQNSPKSGRIIEKSKNIYYGSQIWDQISQIPVKQQIFFYCHWKFFIVWHVGNVYGLM